MKTPQLQRGDFHAKDMEIFKFLWIWKSLTNQTLAKRYWPNVSSDAGYKRLGILKKRGYVKFTALDGDGSKFAWVLTRKGFDTVLKTLPSLREEGFRSEFKEHDFYVTACQLGEWLVNRPAGVEIFSEQQLRRLNLESYPSWVPRTERHRPDGYWQVPYKDSKLVIALEVELNFKSKNRYEVIGQFYKKQSSINRVCWVTDSLGIAKSLHEIFKREDQEYLKHNFILLKDFLILHWEAPIVMGYEQGKTLQFVLGIRSTESKHPSHSGSCCDVSVLLDTQKRRASSRGLPARPASQNSNSMALPAISNNPSIPKQFHLVTTSSIKLTNTEGDSI